MDQKNTIVKCKAHPNCLFNYNGVCDNYVINIGADGKCEGYIETEWLEQNKEYYDSCYYCQHALHEKNNKWLYCEIDGLKIDQALRSDQCKQFQSVYSKGLRAKCNVYDDACDEKLEIKIPDPKNTDIHFVIQNAWCNEELLRDQMCWFCDNGKHGKCKLTAKPALDRTGKCPSYKSTGGNR